MRLSIDPSEIHSLISPSGEQTGIHICDLEVASCSPDTLVEFTMHGYMGEQSQLNSVKKILQSGNRTIVFWSDGTKTIVKRADDEEDNPYVAFTAALAIKTYGNNSQVKSIIDHKLEIRAKIDGKTKVVEDYESRKRNRKWLKNHLKEKSHEQKTD